VVEKLSASLVELAERKTRLSTDVAVDQVAAAVKSRL